MNPVTRRDASKVLKIAVADTTAAGDLIGGAQMFLVDFLSGLVRRGHDVHFVTTGEPDDRIRSKLISTGSTVHTKWTAPGRLVDDATPLAAGRLKALVPDVYVVSVSGDVGWTVLPFLQPETATLTIGHNDEETFYSPAKHYHQFLTRAVGVSEAICGNYVKSCHMPAERVDWIPYGVQTRETMPEPLDNPLRLIYVGRFEEEQKRISDVVAIAKKLSSTVIDFEARLVGDGEAMPMVRRELAGEIESGKVRLMGWLASEEVIGLMNQSEIFVLASAYEGFCISLTEAMANGCCPIVTDIRSGNKQLVRDGENGFIVPVGDIEAFVDRIRILDNDRDRLLRMRQAAWETGRQYSVERMVASYEDCFRRAVEDAKANPRTPDPDFPLMPSCRSKYPLWLRRIKAKAKSFVANR